ncbi:MAG: hypothetical protein KDB37_14030 [Ilumatobacter sp.]|nr:hypothetical protein [Ilumatobacter sp.]
MTDVDLLIIWANLVMVIAAILANVVGAVGDDPRQRPMWAAIAALGVLYAGGYLWVLNTGDTVSWSRAFRGVSIAAWAIVWIVPPLRSVWLHRRDLAAMRHQAKSVKKRIDR